MPKQISRLCLAFLLILSLGHALAADQSATGDETISPGDARRAVSVLQDEQQRAEAVRALKAIADTAPAKDADAAKSDDQLADDTAADTAAPAEAPAAVAIEANGLIARTLRQVSRWGDGLEDQLHQIKQAVLAFPVWLRTHSASGQGKHILSEALVDLTIVFGVGLALEWGLRYLLGRPRRALIQHAEEADERARLEQAERDERQRLAQAQARARAEREQAEQAAVANAAEVGGIRPASEEVALVQTTRDGVEQIEAVPVGATNAAKGGPASTASDSAAQSQQQATVDTVSHDTAASPRHAAMPGEHWSTLRHLPYALGSLIFDLLPLALFFGAAALIMRALSGDEQSVMTVVQGFVGAYVTVRVCMAVVRLLISPIGHGMRIIRVRTDIARTLETWIRFTVVLAAFGIALAEAVEALGAGRAGHLAIVKLFSLLVHLCLVVLIFKVRKPVGALIEAPAEATGPVAALRNWLALVWAFFAAAFVIGLWVVWALGVENGFPKLINFIALSGAVVIAARLLAILVLGAVGRAFQPKTDAPSDESNTPASSVRSRLADRYYPLARRLITATITVCTVIVLFQLWGLDALSWFASGTIGRSLLSAVLTILVAALVAIVVWESANASVQRRLTRWTNEGDLVRAARLRTLLPMLRSFLLIIIVLVVGLTALSQIGINTTPLLAGASIIGVAVGFGSQKLVQDFITGIFLLMENAMQVGDWVTVAGVSGTVEYLSIRTVRIRAGDGSLHIVPFSSVSTVNNINRGIGNASIRINVGYNTDIDQVFDELKAIGAEMRQDPAFKDLIINDLEVWGVDAVDGSMVTVLGQMRCIDKGRWGVQRETNRRILKRFRELGITIADPRTYLVMPSETAATDRSPLPHGNHLPSNQPSPDA
ncbi:MULTISPECIES: mechanosensitive ion channel family protein [unclassified Pseudomonas]|uniref:mechanosensitive ion channel family protein n=1 Tax=unclassified Pseudomonas TaxID=196821 RepID=UPI00257A18A7|nr:MULTISPECIES: mechanosensitive ion channel domain-containing protein [unclassified Pseudomonas]